MAQVDLAVPDLGGFNDVPVIEVLVKPGDAIRKDDPLVTLESDKATMEVPASAAGTIREIKVKVGDKVSQGSVLAVVDADAKQDSTPPTPPEIQSTDAVGVVAADASAEEEVSGVEADVAPNVTLTESRSARDSSKGEPQSSQPTTESRATAPAPSPPAPSADKVSTNGATVHASPAIRRFARELGVDLHTVRGSGPNGRISREDVQSYVKSALTAPQPPTAGAVSGLGLRLPPWPSVDFAKFGPIERVPLTRIQRISGPVLARNWVMIPHVTQDEDADVTELEAFRKSVNGERQDVKLTMLAFLMKAAVAALKRYPPFNASLDGDELVLKKYYHLGFAADTPQGLLVPVIRDVDRKGILEIAHETAELAAKARDGKLGPNEMTGATFTISSLGSIGGTYFTPIINAPEVAILGACKAETRAVWNGETFVPRLIQPLSLSYDHRVIDGANAARFIVEVKHALSDLRRVLL